MITRARNSLVGAIAAALLVSAAAPALAASAVLTVSINVDKIVARPGEVLTYKIRLENVGDADAANVEVTSHIPSGTHEASQNCPNGTFEPNGDICINPDFPAPGLGGDAHQIDTRFTTLSAGTGITATFKVQIETTTPIGTHIPNHAHATALLTPQADSAPVDTLVVGLVPNGTFGGDTVTVSGGSVTDSYDSSVGPYSVSHSNSDGNIASNGNISVSGGAVINGDATPGPAHTVTISNNSTVTGSTAPVVQVVQLNDVDATTHAANNDDAKICAPPGSCSGVTYNAATHALTVSGSATLGSGAYYVCSLTVTGTLNIAGTVSLWVGAPSVCGGASSVRFSSFGANTIASGRSKDFQILMQGGATSTLTLESHASLTGVVYAPGSSLSLAGGASALGGFTLGTVATGGGGGFLHFDRSLTQ